MVRAARFNEDLIWEGPSARHQIAVRNLTLEMMRNCPRGLEVLPGPLVVWPFNENLFQPDVIVVKKDSIPKDHGRLTELPLLIVEVIDDRSRSWDQHLKRILYANQYIQHYWHFDPSVPEFVAYRHDDDSDEYKHVVSARGDERVGLDSPVLVEICPARLAKA